MLVLDLTCYFIFMLGKAREANDHGELVSEPALKKAIRKGFQSVLYRLEHHADRLRPDYIPALLERYPTNKIPPRFETQITTAWAQKFSESLVTPAQHARLDRSLSHLADGTHIMEEVAGTPKDGNRHIHRFVVKKSGADIEMYYVDPEHSMGKSINHGKFGLPRVGDIRPRVNVLYVAKMTIGSPIISASLLRYRSAVITKDQQGLNKPTAQFKIAEQMIATGKLPQFLVGNQNEITFHLDFRKQGDTYTVITQARAADTTQEVEALVQIMLGGKPLPLQDPLARQVTRFQAIMRTYFPRYLEENKFKLVAA